ncbi:MAG: SDR family oxidoreductase [Burkholderiales bacterium]|nr:SDR family oxidoreductase [Burkholderiales bacterium]
MKRKRLLIVGCGDIALRAVELLGDRYRLYGLTRDTGQSGKLRALGITPIIGDLDDRKSLVRLAGVADWVLHTAPPPPQGRQDTRTAALLNALSKGRMVPQRLTYISTSGVYGDCAGEWVGETRTPRPQSERAVRRRDAEQRLRRWGRRRRVSVSLLRAPGIYAADRLPLERLKKSLPVLCAGEDSYSNHIHADDLARIALLAFSRGGWGRSYNAADNSALAMGDYFDLVADHLGLPRPPRVSRQQAEKLLPATMLSFIAESRRLVNHRVLKEFRISLRYPTVASALESTASGKAFGAA